MINRIRNQRRFEAWQYSDFYEVETRHGTRFVSMSTALHIARELDARTEPEWVEFQDIFGAHERVEARDVLRISESTLRTRLALRELTRRS